MSQKKPQLRSQSTQMVKSGMQISQDIDQKVILPLLKDPNKKEIFFKRLSYQIENMEENVQKMINTGIKQIKVIKREEVNQNTENDSPKKLKQLPSTLKELKDDQRSKELVQMIQYETNVELKSQSSSLFNHSQRQLEKTRHSSKIRKIGNSANLILSYEQRKNPFYEFPPVRMKDLENGIEKLVNKGRIAQDIDLTPVFEKGVPSILLAPIKLLNVNEKKKKFEYLSILEQQQLKLNEMIYKQKSILSSNQKHEQNNLSAIIQQINPFDQTYPNSDLQEEQNDISLFKNESIIEKKSLQSIKLIKFTNYQIEQNSTFCSFKEDYAYSWGTCCEILQKFIALMKKYKFPSVLLFCSKLGNLSVSLQKPTQALLIDCIQTPSVKKSIQSFITRDKIIDQNQMETEKKASSIIYLQFLKKQIQKNLHKKTIEQIRFEKSKQIILLFRNLLQTKVLIKKNIVQRNLQVQKINTKFQKDWPEIKTQKRIEIHIHGFQFNNEFRQTTQDLNLKKNIQISRIFSIIDPLIDVIYILPIELSPEIINDYFQILESSGISKPQERITFIYPEQAKNFPLYYSTIKLLLFSPIALRKIKKLMRKKIFYIVPSIPSQDDSNLAYILNCPTFCSNPFEPISISSTKYIIEKNYTGTCPGIYISKKSSIQKIVQELLSFIIQNQEFTRWIFKINNQINSRGLAYIDIDLRQIQKKLKFEGCQLNLSYEQQMIIQNLLIEMIPIKLQVVSYNLYRNNDQFLSEFQKSGGIIEVYPLSKCSNLASNSVSFCLEPDGNFQLLGTYEKFQSNYLQSYGAVYPDSSVESTNYLKLQSEKISQILYQQGYYGYFTMDFISFKHPQEGQIVWSLGMHQGLNEYSSIINLFKCITKTRFSNQLNKFISISQNLNAVVQNNQLIKQSSLLSSQINQSPDRSPHRRKTTIHSNKPIVNWIEGLSNINQRYIQNFVKIQNLVIDQKTSSGMILQQYDLVKYKVLGILNIQSSEYNIKYQLIKTVQSLLNQMNYEFESDQPQFIPQRCQLLNFEEIIKSITILLNKLKLVEAQTNQITDLSK